MIYLTDFLVEINKTTMVDFDKVAVIQSMIEVIRNDHPEFEEENTTGWELMWNAYQLLEDLKDEQEKIRLQQILKTNNNG
jgi:hypothetical protein